MYVLCQFPWCQYSHRGQFQVTSRKSRSGKLLEVQQPRATPSLGASPRAGFSPSGHLPSGAGSAADGSALTSVAAGRDRVLALRDAWAGLGFTKHFTDLI